MENIASLDTPSKLYCINLNNIGFSKILLSNEWEWPEAYDQW